MFCGFMGKLKIVSVYSIIRVRRLMKLNRATSERSAENAGLKYARLQNNMEQNTWVEITTLEIPVSVHFPPLWSACVWSVSVRVIYNVSSLIFCFMPRAALHVHQFFFAHDKHYVSYRIETFFFQFLSLTFTFMGYYKTLQKDGK